MSGAGLVATFLPESDASIPRHQDPETSIEYALVSTVANPIEAKPNRHEGKFYYPEKELCVINAIATNEPYKSTVAE